MKSIPWQRHAMVFQRVDSAGLVEIHHGGGVFGWIKADLFKPDICRVPVHWIFHCDDAVVGHPFGQMKRSAGDDVLRQNPVRVAKLLDGLAMDHHKELMRHHAEKIG